MIQLIIVGEVGEWLKSAVLKTVVPKGTGGSNPSLSAKKLSRFRPKKKIKNMEITYFVLGALSVITIVSVVGVVRIRGEMKRMVSDELSKLARALHDQIGHERVVITREVDKLHTLIGKKSEEMYSYIDSKIDKQFNWCQKNFDKISNQNNEK